MSIKKLLPLIIMLLKKECELRITKIAKISDMEIRTVQAMFNCRANKSMHHEGDEKIEVLKFENLFDLDRKHPDYSSYLHVDLLEYVIKRIAETGILIDKDHFLNKYYNIVYGTLDCYTICEMCGSNITHYENY